MNKLAFDYDDYIKKYNMLTVDKKAKLVLYSMGDKFYNAFKKLDRKYKLKDGEAYKITMQRYLNKL